MPKLHVENITKQYPTRTQPLDVLRGVSLALDPGENVAILGPSGSGKSTLLSIIGTLETATSGRVLLDGVDPAALDERGLAAFRSRRIGFVFQDHYLLPQCSVLENVLLSAVPLGPVEDATLRRAEMLLERVGLSDRRNHRPAELSGGERQRAALARALVNSPELLLADEPTGNLDRTTAQQVGELLVDIQKTEPMMLIVVTHSERLAELMQKRRELDAGVLRDEGQQISNEETKQT
jgi:lipoprotein-releasing system ATP-binding protein